ncbi:MAG TPA: hypothetical protein VEA69_13975 [Tepidisphaeraceae bacterium]|nr:hypothetical protein [Tepidisphaeraceae bacterium]
MRVLTFVLLLPTLARAADTVPDTAPLTTPAADIPAAMLAGIDRFLDKQTALAPAQAEKLFAGRTPEQRRERLAYLLGMREKRPGKVEMELVATTDRPALVAKTPQYDVFAVRWRAFADVYGEGLLIQPRHFARPISVIAIPDADHTPEMIAGLVEGVDPKSQYARNLAAHGRYRILIPALLDRKPAKRPAPGRKDGPEFSDRELVFRTAFNLGRHPIGYDLTKILAGLDWLDAQPHAQSTAVIGWGEGGMLALYAGALDERIAVTCVGGYFGRRDGLWAEPIERTVWNRLTEFGDAQLAAMGLSNRSLVIETSAGPSVQLAGKGGAPGRLGPPSPADVLRAFANESRGPTVVSDGDPAVAMNDQRTLEMVRAIYAGGGSAPAADPVELLAKSFDPAPRQSRQLAQLVAHTQSLIPASQQTRSDFFKPLAKISDSAKYEAALQPFRDKLHTDVLGKFDLTLSPASPRTRKLYDTEKFTGYEVQLDVFAPDVFAYGVLLLPKDLKPNERRPVVVCQHGLEGTPQQTITGDHRAYHDFAAKLADRGFIVFAPQNSYVLGERFRQLSRKAWPIGKTLWSWIIPQHQQILNFLKGLPNVDAKRIAFYGLSYGGKTALRVPAVLTDYCLSICSGDFNEWVAKISSTAWPFSYVFTHEYEIYEWDLASTFNHAEMAALIAPRPFMVERGHYDGVSSDELVAYEFAKVRRLYQGQLKIPDRCAIEWFDGPHTINGKGTFEFLHRHLQWEQKK